MALTGLGVFLIFRARAEVQQVKQFSVFKGLCEKFEKTTAATKAPDATLEPDREAILSAPQVPRQPQREMLLLGRDQKMIQQAKGRLSRWPRVRLTLMAVSAASIILSLALYSRALMTGRPEPMSMRDRFVCVALSTLSLVVAAICLSRVIANWKGSRIDRLVATFADRTR